MLVEVWLVWCLLFLGHHQLSSTAPTPHEPCPSYDRSSKYRTNKQLSEGRHQLPYQRPVERCRKFQSPVLENTIARLRSKIADPDLFRLFENAYPNTLDTAVLWTGFAAKNGSGLPYSNLTDTTDEDLAFVITGDMYVLPPPESNIPLGTNYAYTRNKVNPPYDRKLTFDCKWELDSLASFLHISSEYHNATGDMAPFTKYQWVETIRVILDAVEAMRTATYTADGHIAPSGYTMTGQTNRATETTSNDGLGNPVKYTGMIRSTFRPSDDATIHQFLIPSNMMFARYLETASAIMEKIQTQATDPAKAQEAENLTQRMRTMAHEIRAGITKHGIIHHPLFGPIFAFEVDGYGSHNLMDDANLPSLLSAALMGYVSPRDHVYLNTRLFALSEENPYWMHGPVLSAIGGPHLGPMKAWPLASIVRIMTSEDGSGEEVREELKALLSTTDGLGLIHEGVNVWNAKDWSRHWFSWANGMFGQMILELENKKPYLLTENYQ
ncbi:MAG: hypothetical protein Q9182_001260 [Xanthomendoza sp. 2 TL-2023]